MNKKKAIICGANLTAEDSGVKIEVSLHVTSTQGLQRDEVEDIQTKLVRGIAEAMERCPYSDFGIESIIVEILDQEARTKAAA